MPRVVWYGNNEGMYRGWYDQAIFEWLFKDFEHTEGPQSLQDGVGSVVVLPGRSLVGQEDKIAQELNKCPWVYLVVAGDEERKFDISKIKHPNMKVMCQNPKPGLDDKHRKIGCGWTPHTVRGELPTKELDWVFMGQVTHSRRQECVEQLRNMPNGYLLESEGFTQGLKPEEYNEKMSQAKIVPCPSGPVTPDNFRLHEALELGCIPIADEITGNGEHWKGYWEWIFGEPVPFPVIEDYESLPGYINDCLDKFPQLNNECQAFWMRYKDKLRLQIQGDIMKLNETVQNKIMSG